MLNLNEKYITAKELAEYLNVKENTLAKDRSYATGRYPAYVGDPFIGYRPCDVKEWEERNLVKSGGSL